jgi:hypothetical protein
MVFGFLVMWTLTSCLFLLNNKNKTKSSTKVTPCHATIDNYQMLSSFKCHQFMYIVPCTTIYYNYKPSKKINHAKVTKKIIKSRGHHHHHHKLEIMIINNRFKLMLESSQQNQQKLCNPTQLHVINPFMIF